MPPTLSADVSVASALSQASGLSLDAGQFNLGNKTDKVKPRDIDTPHICLREADCRACFALTGSDETLVCGLILTECKRAGHRAARLAMSRGEPGYYRMANKGGHLIDGVFETYMAAEDFAVKEALELEDNRRAVSALGLLTGGGPTDYEGKDAKLPAQDATPDHRMVTRSSKTEKLMVETVSDEDSDECAAVPPAATVGGIPLQGSWTRDSGILKSKLSGKPFPGSVKAPPTVAFPPSGTSAPVPAPAAGRGSGGQDAILFAMLEQLKLTTESLSVVAEKLGGLDKKKVVVATPEEDEVKWWHPVAVGRRPGIYATPGEADLETRGYPSASTQKFRTKEEAERFMARHAKRQAELEKEKADAQILEEAIERALRERPGLDRPEERSRSTLPKAAPNSAPPGRVPEPSHGQAGFHCPRESDPDPIPRAAAPGPSFVASDPSVGNPEKVFGHELGTEAELRERLSPDGIQRVDQRDLDRSVIDATALPGTSLMSEAETTSDLAEVAACLRDGNAAREQQRNAAVKVDGRWAASSRNQLKKVTSDDELQLLCDTIGKVRDRVVKNMHAIMSTIFGNYLWGSDIIGYRTQGNLFSRIATVSLEDYMYLLSYLLRLSRREGWDCAKVALDYHAENLTVIRGTAPSRLNALTSIYIYLRDARVDGFNAPELQEKRNAHICGEFARLEQGIAAGSAASCGKCHGSARVHTGGRAKCPFKNCKDQEARKRAALIDQQFRETSPNREE